MPLKYKFRGKSKLNGKWHYGSLIELGNDWCQIVTSQQHDDGIPDNTIRVISDSVGMCVAVIDGKEIYEGDLVNIGSKDSGWYMMLGSRERVIFEIKLIGTVFALKRVDIDFVWGTVGRLIELNWMFETVGNVHDSPLWPR